MIRKGNKVKYIGTWNHPPFVRDYFDNDSIFEVIGVDDYQVVVKSKYNEKRPPHNNSYNDVKYWLLPIHDVVDEEELFKKELDRLFEL